MLSAPANMAMAWAYRQSLQPIIKFKHAVRRHATCTSWHGHATPQKRTRTHCACEVRGGVHLSLPGTVRTCTLHS
eukprot:5995085-Alexandrium_andersonii.AAC.1